jgi:hypothetical protein
MPKRKQRSFLIESCETGNSVVWTIRKCRKVFGRVEFEEMRQGHDPRFVVTEMADDRS